MTDSPEREQAEALRELIQSLVDCEPEMSSHDFTVKALPLLVQATDALAAAAVGRERELTRALAAAEVALSMASEIHGKIEFDTPEDNRLRDEAVKVFAFATKAVREALAGGVSAAGRPPEHALHIEGGPDGLRIDTEPGGGTAAVAEAGKRWRVDICECGHPSATHARWGVHRAGSCSATVYIAHTNGANAYPCNCRGFRSEAESRTGTTASTHPTSGHTEEDAVSDRMLGICDEYGTIWSGEPGASERIGDLVQRADEETYEVRLS